MCVPSTISMFWASKTAKAEKCDGCQWPNGWMLGPFLWRPRKLVVLAQSLSRVRLFCDPMDCGPPGSFCPWNFPGKSNGVGCHFVLQGIFPIQGSNQSLSCLLHWEEGSLPLAPPEKPLKKAASASVPLFPAPSLELSQDSGHSPHSNNGAAPSAGKPES